MDGFEVNKILGALLGTALLIVALKNFSEVIFRQEPLTRSAYPVPGVSDAGPAGGEATKPEPLDIPALLAAAKPERGQRVFEKCLACHTIAKGAPDSTGPNLWGIVGAPTGHRGDAYPYSTPLKKLGGEWSYDRLFSFLENPAGIVPGTKMTFAGLSKRTDRADVIAYMRAQSDNPPPLPQPAAPAPAADGAAAPGAETGAPAAGANGAAGAPSAGGPAQDSPASPTTGPKVPAATERERPVGPQVPPKAVPNPAAGGGGG